MRQPTAKCSNCLFFHPDQDNPTLHGGECRYSPPTDKGFPRCQLDHWCGGFVDKFDNDLPQDVSEIFGEVDED